MAHWPGRISGGRVSDHLCYFPDMMATLCELAGAKSPADSDGCFDWQGKRIAP